MIATRLLAGFLHDASILVVDHKGIEHHCGPKHILPSCTLRINSAALERRFLFQPQLAFAEGYMRGEITIEDGSLRDALVLFARQQQHWRRTAPKHVRQFVRAWANAANAVHQMNFRGPSKRNVQHHYDIGNRVFELFLGPAMQYTCGYFSADVLPTGDNRALARYFENRVEDLALAERQRMAHMIAKLRLSPGMRVLDVGCGWGGFALEMARTQNVDVLGISLSVEQLKHAQKQADDAGLSTRIKLQLTDYRDVKGQFDRINAAGILEHIGKPHFGTFFNQLKSLLAPDGVILVDATGRVDSPGGTNPWLRKYIYPGGYIPALSEVQRAIEASGLELLDAEIQRVHYALTIREWERRFMQASGEITALMGAEFVRMWQLYLIASEMGFVYGRFVNFQLQLGNSRFTVPVTRDYLTAKQSELELA